MNADRPGPSHSCFVDESGSKAVDVTDILSFVSEPLNDLVVSDVDLGSSPPRSAWLVKGEAFPG